MCLTSKRAVRVKLDTTIWTQLPQTNEAQESLASKSQVYVFPFKTATMQTVVNHISSQLTETDLEKKQTGAPVMFVIVVLCVFNPRK